MRGVPVAVLLLASELVRTAHIRSTSAHAERATVALSACGAGCGEQGVCIAGACICTNGYGSSSHYSTRRKEGGCTKPPDPCTYPVAVRCGNFSTCVGGACQPLSTDLCRGECGPRQQCLRGVCTCQDGLSGDECADSDECASAPCQHGSQCFQSAHVLGHLGGAHAQLLESWTDQVSNAIPLLRSQTYCRYPTMY